MSWTPKTRLVVVGAAEKFPTTQSEHPTGGKAKAVLRANVWQEDVELGNEEFVTPFTMLNSDARAYPRAVKKLCTFATA
jgi:hypothetical protein